MSNALRLVNKTIEDVQLVVSGGAGAIAGTQLYLALDIKQENIVIF